MKKDIPLRRLFQTLGEGEESKAETALNYCDKRLGLAEQDASCARHTAIMTSPVKFFRAAGFRSPHNALTQRHNLIPHHVPEQNVPLKDRQDY